MDVTIVFSVSKIYEKMTMWQQMNTKLSKKCAQSKDVSKFDSQKVPKNDPFPRIFEKTVTSQVKPPRKKVNTKKNG